MERKHKVVIVGAGFGGLNTAKRLGQHPDAVDVTVVDRKNHHLFQPLLYQVAMAGLSPADIAVPIRSVLSDLKNVDVTLGNVTAVDLTHHTLTIDDGTLTYDSLVLACGANHSYFGHDEWEPYAPGLKTLEQATEIRRRVLLAFEEADREKESEKQKQLLTFVVVGGGPTGVELAGALGEITRHTLSRDFRHIDSRRTRIILIEAGPRILTSFTEELASRAQRDLEQLGVQVWTSSRVTNISRDGVSLDKEFVHARTVLWAAGVRPSSLNVSLGVPLDKGGRVIVEKDLSISGHSSVFVIGDQAHAEDESGYPYPGLAPVAMQQGRLVAENILARLKGQPTRSFQYRDKGQMATIGRRKAVAQTKHLQFGGTFAWLAWLFVHIYYLVGFKNRIMVLFQWFWSYMTFGRGARLIVNKDWISTTPRGDAKNLAAAPPTPTSKLEGVNAPASSEQSVVDTARVVKT